MARTTGCLPSCPENVLSKKLEIIWFECVAKLLRGTEFSKGPSQKLKIGV